MQTEVIEAPKVQITEYSKTAAALAELRKKYEGVIFPVDTTKGMKDATAARKELRTLRTDLEKLRTKIKAPALERCRLIDSEAKAITAQLTALEDPIDAQIKAEEERKAREKAEREEKERQRVAAIREKIERLQRLAVDSAYDSAEDIELTLADLNEYGITEEEFAELTEEAAAVRTQAMADLGDLLNKARVREEAEKAVAEERARIEAERAEIERQKRELEEMRAKIEAQAAKAEPEPEAPEHKAEEQAKNEADTTTPPFEVTDDMRDDAREPGPTPTNVVVPGDAPAPDADAWAAEYARYTALQFLAMADKVAAFGFNEFAGDLRAVAHQTKRGDFDSLIAQADREPVTAADKNLALASHACVAAITGDEALGKSVLRALNDK